MIMRSKFTVSGQYVTHTGEDLWTGEAFERRYWVPTGGGYVRLDDSRHGDRPGPLGTQPTTDGVTWRAVDVADLLEQVRADWRRERRVFRQA